MNVNGTRLKLVNIGKSFGNSRARWRHLESRVEQFMVCSARTEPANRHCCVFSQASFSSDGHVELDGVRLQGRGPVAAREAGIAMIHQELQHVPNLTVAQNMFLGRPLKTAGGLLVDRRAQERPPLPPLPHWTPASIRRFPSVRSRSRSARSWRSRAP